MASRCRRCGVAIDWVTTTNGKPMPLDPKRVTVVLDDGRVVQGRLPHWGSCPYAEEFRKR